MPMKSNVNYDKIVHETPKLTLRDMQTAWHVVARSLKKCTLTTKCSRGTMFVNVADSVLLHQLTFYKKKYMDTINADFGIRIIQDIVFRVDKNINKRIKEYNNLPTIEQRLEILKTMPYNEYLQTLEWKDKAKEKKEETGYACQVCNELNKVLHVHHRTYERRGNELMSDLTVLCEDCHSLFHGYK